MCMSDVLNKHRIPYAFLQDMKDRFLAEYGSEAPLQAIAFSYNEEFSPVIAERMNFYNSGDAELGIDNIGAVKSQIEDVKNVMVQNIEKVRLTGGRCLEQEQNELEYNSPSFITFRSWSVEKKLNYWSTRPIDSINKPFGLNRRVAICDAPCIGARCVATRTWVPLSSFSSWSGPLRSAVEWIFAIAERIIEFVAANS